MLTRSGAKLLDFGLAKIAEPASPLSVVSQMATGAPLTTEGMILGTFQYMSPEQLEAREADARSDIWALGCLLYEMATGRKAFLGRTQASLISAILKDEPPPVSELAPLAPPALDHVVRACLAKNPNERWQDARDIGRQLCRARQQGTKGAKTGAVTVVQRTSADLRLNPHLHAVVLDGAWYAQGAESAI